MPYMIDMTRNAARYRLDTLSRELFEGLVRLSLYRTVYLIDSPPSCDSKAENA